MNFVSMNSPIHESPVHQSDGLVQEWGDQSIGQQVNSLRPSSARRNGEQKLNYCVVTVLFLKYNSI